MAMKDKKSQKSGSFKKFYHLYKQDLSFQEIERLIKWDVPSSYDFYSRSMERPDQKKNRFYRALIFGRNFFIAFLLKLSPARRLFYSVSLFLFIYAILIGMTQWVVLAFVTLNILLALEVADKLLAKSELEVAREIQTSLMPKSVPQGFPYDISFFAESALEVGGDYYDFIQPVGRDNGTYVVIGDVKGKGMAAALYMARIQALLQYISQKQLTPSQILIELNRNVRKILTADYFISLLISHVNSRGQLSFCRAGHLPLVHYDAASSKIRVLEPAGMAVGLDNGKRFEETIEERTITPGSGDIFVYYTDGISEAMNEEREQYGEAALLNQVKRNASKSAQAIKNAIMADLESFRGKATPHDDLTLLVMKVR
jgi:serine phosphatase RsbU (regulator of sigma subunit)